MKQGRYELALLNKYSLRFTFFKEDKEKKGILSANKLRGFTLDNSGNPLPKRNISLAWENGSVRVFDIDYLISVISETSLEDNKPFIKAIYEIHNNRHKISGSVEEFKETEIKKDIDVDIDAFVIEGLIASSFDDTDNDERTYFLKNKLDGWD